MNMTFQEKSAWGLLVGIGLVSYFYFPAAFEVAGRVPHGAALIALSAVGVVALVIIESIYHAIIAVPDGEQTDERDALFDLKAERNASLVLGFGLVSLVGHIVISNSIERVLPLNGMTIAVWILFLMTLSEIAKLLSQIVYYRLNA